MYPFVRFIYFTTAALFIGFLMFSYYQLPDQVAISLNGAAGLSRHMPKPEFFYWCAGSFLLVNMLIGFLIKVAPFMPFRVLPVPNKKFWLENKDTRRALVKVFLVWFNSFAAIFNLYTGFIVLFVFLINIHAIGTFWSYRYFVWGGLWLLSFWWLVLAGRLLVKQHEL